MTYIVMSQTVNLNSVSWFILLCIDPLCDGPLLCCVSHWKGQLHHYVDCWMAAQELLFSHIKGLSEVLVHINKYGRKNWDFLPMFCCILTTAQARDTDTVEY